MKELKTFRKYLKEGKQVGPLYHFTDAKGTISIVKDNKLKASSDAQNYVLNTNPGIIYNPSRLKGKHISFSRNQLSTDNHYLRDKDVRFTLDGDKLSNKYKTQPFSLKGKPKALSKYGASPEDIEIMQHGDDESEERIPKDIPGVNAYITEISFNTGTITDINPKHMKTYMGPDQSYDMEFKQRLLDLMDALITIYEAPALPNPTLYSEVRNIPPKDVLSVLDYNSLDELESYKIQFEGHPLP